MRSLVFLGVLMTGVVMNSCATDPFADKAPAEHVRAQLAKLEKVELQIDLNGLADGDLRALAKLHDAAKIIDELFLLQVDPQNPQIRQSLHRAKLTDHLALHSVMFGKWNRLADNEPFLDLEEKPLGAGFYPPDMHKEEFESYLAAHPEKAAEFKSEFTLIRRQDGDLVAIPYHKAYKEQVERIAALLQEAAQWTSDTTLARFLSLRSQAFLSDDYFASDMAWMDLAGDLEIVIAPYEVYEDELFNYKAAYEAFLCRVDHEESAKLETVAHYLNEMEANLPIPDSYKNYNRGSSSPIKVVNELFSAGDTKAGIQTTAFNLPNDERVREAKGSKKVMLKNIARAKFDKCWIPIVNTLLAEEPLQHVSFEAYFNHVLMHEMSHGLGPGNITLANGRATSVRDELKELYSIMEECKADVLGIWNLKFLIDKGVFPAQLEESMYASYLGGMFRSIRFGIDAAHGGGVAIQFNFLMEKGAFYVDAGKLTYDKDKFWPAFTELASMLLTLQARGDYDGAAALIAKYRHMTPVMQNYIDQLKDVPVDIRPIFTLEEKLAAM